MRINKFIAHTTGISRREADNAISAGRVHINQQRANLGSQVHAKDAVTLDGKALVQHIHYTYLALHKPVGYLCSRRSQGGVPTIYSLVPEQYRKLKAVGRLDKNSSGLILLTDDGDFAHRMTHPSFYKVKLYEVELDRPLEPLHQQMISDYGVTLEDGVSRFLVEKIDREDEIARQQDRKIARSRDRETAGQLQDSDTRVTSGGAAPTFGGHAMDAKVGADQTAANVPLARNFTVENKFSPEDSLADSHRLSSPASSDLRPGAKDGTNDGSGGQRQCYLVTMSEGRNRQIRRTFAALGYTVTRLHRTQFGSYILDTLSAGHIREFALIDNPTVASAASSRSP